MYPRRGADRPKRPTSGARHLFRRRSVRECRVLTPATPPTEHEAFLAAELARTRRALRRSEQRFRAAFGHQFQFMAILSPEGRVIDFNEQLAGGTGLPRDEVIGRLFWETAWWQGQPERQAAWPQRLREAVARGSVVVEEDRFISSSGEPRWASAAVQAVRDESGDIDCFIVQATDITARKQAQEAQAALEAQMRETHKLQAIGTLAGGIAHDFNNILGAILGNVALARDAIGPQHAALDSLQLIKRAASRGRSLVQQILAFSRQQPQQLRVQPLQPVIEETLALLRTTLPKTVTLHHRLTPAALWVRCDPTQIQQVLMNLCTNAWHALPEGCGRIEVGVGRDDDGRVRLWVSDDGVGMDTATQRRVFEPFFTTKPVDQGTGLGLSVVHGIVVDHGGEVRIDSAPGRGSVFHVLLPSADPDLSTQPASDSTLGALDAGVRHVLYLDDDEVMVPVARQLLERAGHRVTTHRDPQAAIAELAVPGHGIDVVVTDFNMPGCNGLEVVRRLAQVSPGLPVVLCSGYFDEHLREQAAALGVRHLLPKEDTLDELCRVVRRVIRGEITP
jgi:PAS domain S-box-containing protein